MLINAYQREGVYVKTGGFIYAIGAEGEPSVKIGKTARPVAKRLAALQIGYPARLQIRAAVPVEQDLNRIEKAIHRFLESDRQQGEWFAVQVDQDQLQALIVRAVQWLAAEETRKATLEAEKRAALEAMRRARRAAEIGTMGESTQLGTRIRRRRRDLDLTQAHLAKISGIPQYHISGIEVGRIVEIKTDTLRKLTRALHVSADWLLGLTDDESALEPTAVDLVGA
jgi:ribosome-binding protein aMBF1 (putative translation factor)